MCHAMRMYDIYSSRDAVQCATTSTLLSRTAFENHARALNVGPRDDRHLSPQTERLYSFQH